MKNMIISERELFNQLPDSIQIEGDFSTKVIRINGIDLLPFTSQAVRNHSPTGFLWGYAGSGPAQLALAILLVYLPIEVALDYYQSFKFSYISGLPQTDFIKRCNLRSIMLEMLKDDTTTM